MTHGSSLNKASIMQKLMPSTLTKALPKQFSAPKTKTKIKEKEIKTLLKLLKNENKKKSQEPLMLCVQIKH